MSRLDQGVGAYSMGQSNLPSVKEAEEQVQSALAEVISASGRYVWAREQMQIIGQAPEIIAHRAQHLADLAGALSMAAHILQRAAYAQATNPQAVENLPSDPSRAE